MAHKTKAAMPGRQCNNTKHIQDTRLVAGGQSLGAPEVTGTAPLARLGGMPVVGPTPFGFTNFSVYQQGTAMAHTPQPFGSMPLDCNSLRRIRFIQVASDESPSCFAISSSCARNSSGKRIWYCGDLFSSCVDMVVTEAYYHLHGNDHCNYSCHKRQRPVVLRTHTGRLTKTLYEVTNMADQQHTQTHPKFTWLFLATPKSHPDCSPVVLRFDTDTEENARAAFPGWEMVFAAKIRTEAPCRVAFFDYNTRRGWAFDSASDREVVGHD